MSSIDIVLVVGATSLVLGAVARASLIAWAHRTGLPLLLAGWLLLLAGAAPSGLHDHAVPVLGAAAVGAMLTVLMARQLRGREHWVLACGALVLTIRIPVPTGDGSAMLLAPLYAVTLVGAVMLIAREHSARRSIPLHRGGATRLLDVSVALVPIAAAASLSWTFDADASLRMLAFFLAPFLILYWVVRSWLSVGVSIRGAGWSLLTSAVVAAAVGLYQAGTRSVWWNPKVIEANRFRADLRTNSLYWDPNIYGRALVVGAMVLVAWLLVARMRRSHAAGALAALAVLSGALWNTYSQSSWLAAAAALGVIAVLTLPPRPRRWVAAVLALTIVLGLPVAASRLAGDDASSRQHVVRTGISLAAERPLAGWGAGAFEPAARARALDQGDRTPGLVASHTTPITVFAELGILGAFAYLTLLASATTAVLARWRRTASLSLWPGAPLVWASATLVVLLTHSLLYAGFFEDATLWAALAVLGSLPLLDPADQPAATQLGATEAAPKLITV